MKPPADPCRALRRGALAPLRAAGTLIDITQRRQREEALHSSERKLAEIFRASPEMIVVSRQPRAITGILFWVVCAFAPLVRVWRLHQVLERVLRAPPT